MISNNFKKKKQIYSVMNKINMVKYTLSGCIHYIIFKPKILLNRLAEVLKGSEVTNMFMVN